MTYPIINVNISAKSEPLGTKEKFWFYDENDGIIKLFKVGRPSTGENWAEKVTSEIAKLFELPCAIYDFAEYRKQKGVATPIFVPKDGMLIHGNELLGKFVENYPLQMKYKAREYKLMTVITLLEILQANENLLLPIGYNINEVIKNPVDLFIGYLMFDCFIANPDRHHENWCLVNNVSNNSVHLAPTFDHASGLGCRVPDKERIARLNTNDKRFNIKHFVTRSTSPFYDKKSNLLKTFDVFKNVAEHRVQTACYWLDKLENLSVEKIKDIFNQVPENLISKVSITFAIEILKENKTRLLLLKKELLK